MFEDNEICKKCKYYHPEDNGWCEYQGKFKDDDDTCYRFDSNER